MSVITLRLCKPASSAELPEMTSTISTPRKSPSVQLLQSTPKTPSCGFGLVKFVFGTLGADAGVVGSVSDATAIEGEVAVAGDRGGVGAFAIGEGEGETNA